MLVRYLKKECGDLNEVTSDNNGDKNNDDDDDDDDDDANSEDIKVVEIGTGEAPTMLNRLVNLKYQSKEDKNSLVTMKDKLEKIRVLSKNQIHINDYFMIE